MSVEVDPGLIIILIIIKIAIIVWFVMLRYFGGFRRYYPLLQSRNVQLSPINPMQPQTAIICERDSNAVIICDPVDNTPEWISSPAADTIKPQPAVNPIIHKEEN